MLITDGLEKYAMLTPEKPAIISDTTRITYFELYQKVRQVAGALLGHRKSVDHTKNIHKVAILLDNQPEFLEVFLGTAMVGSLSVVFDTKWTWEKIRQQVETYHPNLLVTEYKHYQTLKDLIDCPMVVIDEKTSDKGEHPLFYKDWLRMGPHDSPFYIQVFGGDLFYMGFTSGTTGNPKGFVRTHASWVQTFRSASVEFQLTDRDHVLSPGSFVHSLSLYAALHALYIGATFYLEPSFFASKLMTRVKKTPISALHVVPTMLESILREMGETNGEKQFPHLRTVISSGDKLSERTKERFSKCLPNVDLYEYYGASELSFVTVLDPKGNKEKPASVGRPFQGVDISVRDDQGQEVSTGEAGILYVKSRMVFSGYFQNPEATKKVLHDGWATAGDLARLDEDGYVYLVGRGNNMIITGGLNVHPEEIERVVLQMPEVKEAVALGIPDEYWGERVILAAILNPRQQVQKRELRAYCRSRLPIFKRPRQVHIFEQFPYTSSGKVARKELREIILKQ